MLVLPQLATVTWSNMNREWYESKGYSFTGYRKKFTVNVVDLAKFARNSIDVVCDYCGSQVSKRYAHFIDSRNKIVSKDCCVKCSVHKTEEIMLETQRLSMANGESPRYDGIRFSDEFVRLEFDKKGYIKLSEYKTSGDPIEFICKNHIDCGKQSINYSYFRENIHSCVYCRSEMRSGINHPLWKGGITPIRVYLHNCIGEWKSLSAKECNFRCVITNERFNVIHHLYGYNLIVGETTKELGLDMRGSINDYTKEELMLLKDKCLEIHYRYPLGVCLNESIHIEFHQTYGYGDNTPEQFKEFFWKKANELNNTYIRQDVPKHLSFLFD